MRISADQMLKREQEIIELLREKKRLSVSMISGHFGISAVSVRRMIAKMEKEGKIIRTYGGIVEATGDYEEDLKNKHQLRSAEKKAIAIEARKFIREGDIVFLGGGSTTFELAKLLRDASNLLVVTTSVPVAYELMQNPNIEVQIVGGVIRGVTGTVIGPQACNYLNNTHFNKAFIGADSISLERGITTPSHFEVEVEKLIIKSSGSTYVLADYSKFRKVTLTPLAGLNEIRCIITDWSSDPDYLQKIEEKGVQVLRAKKT
jgi:DeoR/GlpR family transcriptional regulator of sugar metabolism